MPWGGSNNLVLKISHPMPVSGQSRGSVTVPKGIMCANPKYKSSQLKINVSPTQLPLYSFPRISLASSVPPEMKGSVTKEKSECRESSPSHSWLRCLNLESTAAIDGPREGLWQEGAKELQPLSTSFTASLFPLLVHSSHPLFFLFTVLFFYF